MSAPLPDSPNPASDVDARAAAWLARRDRGLTPVEQDEYLQWLRENPAHGQATTKHDRTWASLDAIAEWRPADSAVPNPDILAPPHRRRFVTPVVAGWLAVAAALVVGFFVFRAPPKSPTESIATSYATGVRITPQPERLKLADGSEVELNAGARIDVQFRAEERRVRLLQGEAHFTVTANPSRPFIVDAGAFAVRAVGTAFDVRRAAEEIEVIVTEGKVQVESTTDKGADVPASVPLVKGERVLVDLTQPSRLSVSSLQPGELERALAWQVVQLEFEEQPLRDVAAEFNLRNPRRIVIEDPAVGALRVSGRNFRADNLDGFVRLLEMSFGIVAERRDDGTILLRLAK
jgi:transmembrane sensor